MKTTMIVAAAAAAALVATAVCVCGVPVEDAAAGEMLFIQWGAEPARWMRAMEVEALKAAHEYEWIGYQDLTSTVATYGSLAAAPVFPSAASASAAAAFPDAPVHQATVEAMLGDMDYLNLNATLSVLESYHTRMFNTQTGVDSAVWIRDEFVRLAAGSALTINVSLFEHPNWMQPSVIAVMEGDGSTDEVIVMGAHEDSTSTSPDGRAPGADDDGCGVATILEMFRLVASHPTFRPKRHIHWMTYAAEEVGLQGATEIANQYAAQGVDVYAVYQSEMCGWRGETPDLVLIDDAFTDRGLVDFSKKLIEEYCVNPWATDACNSACSDHAAWSRNGARTICTAEAGPSGDLNPHYHRATDLLEHMDTEFASDFVRYGVGFAVELSLAN